MLIGTKHSGYSRANIRLYFDPVTIMATATAAETAAVVTAAEIAAAEAAAIAAAEAAAATAAAEAAAATAATEAAATTAATAANAAPAFNPAGIMEIGGTTAPGAAPLTSEAVQTAAMQAGQNVPYQFSPAELEALQSGQEIARASSAAPPLETTAGFNLKGTMLENTFLNNPSAVTNEMLRNPSITSIPATPPAASVTPPAIPQAVTPSYLQTPTVAPGSGPMTPFEYQLNAPPDTMQGLRLGTGTEGLSMPNTQVSSLSQLPTAEPPSSLMKGLNSAMNWAKANKFETAVGAYAGANALGLLDPSKQTFNDDPYDGPLSKYRMSPNFQGRTATPNIYQPTYPTYAAGGIMNAGPVQSMSDQNNAMGYQQAMAATGGQVANFAKGGKTGSLTDSLDYYKDMMGGKAPAAPSDRADVGIFRDSDPDTMYQDALTAAQIRNAKVNKRANLSVPSMKRPTPMGQINLAAPGIKSLDKEDAKEAAAGGIMGASSLGGYAAGGSPRLLRGPGDGMSDNIPAVIGKKQPARLADGEFVIPADVVSHLGNGSTEAGAKRLHEMMNKVRRDRTGNSKQGKQIVASKYMPK